VAVTTNLRLPRETSSDEPKLQVDVIGFYWGSRVGLLVGLHISLLTLIDAFPGGSLVRLLVGMCICFLTLVDGFHSDSSIGLLVG